MTPVLVDDHLLLQILLGNEPADLRSPGAPVATTGLWYHRLCRAICDTSVVGALSRQLGGVDEDVAEAVVGSIIELPETIAIVSMRDLAWPMGKLTAGGIRLNLLSLEAVAAAQHLSAEICLAAADVNEPLRTAAEEVSTPVRICEDERRNG